MNLDTPDRHFDKIQEKTVAGRGFALNPAKFAFGGGHALSFNWVPRGWLVVAFERIGVLERMDLEAKAFVLAADRRMQRYLTFAASRRSVDLGS